MELFDSVTDNDRSSSAGSSRISGNFISMITMRDHMTRNDAVSEMKRVLNIMKNPNMDEREKLNAMQEKLQADGMMYLFEYLFNRANEDDDTIANNIVTPVDFLDSLFKGMPLLKVIVLDSNDKERKDRYDVYVADCKTGDLTKINFPNKDPKVLYIWFLMHNRQPISRNKIMKAGREIVNIFDLCFPYSEYGDTFRKKLGFNGQVFTAEEGVSEFIKKAKNTGNPAIIEAIANRDNKDWYVMDLTYHKELDLKNKHYAVSLPDEFVQVPNSLKKCKVTEE